jgi:hypothetical protein
MKFCFKRLVGRKYNLVIKFIMADSSGDPGVIATDCLKE